MRKFYLLFFIIASSVIIENKCFSQTSRMPNSEGCFCIGIDIERNGNKKEITRIKRSVCDAEWAREDQAISSLRRSLEELSKKTHEKYTIYPVASFWCKD